MSFAVEKHIQSNVYMHVYRNTLDKYVLWMFLAMFTSDLIASFVRGLILQLATAAAICMPCIAIVASLYINAIWISINHAL